jgi:hypothetical protein
VIGELAQAPLEDDVAVRGPLVLHHLIDADGFNVHLDGAASCAQNGFGDGVRDSLISFRDNVEDRFGVLPQGNCGDDTALCWAACQIASRGRIDDQNCAVEDVGRLQRPVCHRGGA